MAHWNIMLLLAVIVAAALGYGSLADDVSVIAKVLFFVFAGCFILAVLFAVAMEVGLATEEQWSKRSKEDQQSC